jgi:hypothetical protein
MAAHERPLWQRLLERAGAAAVSKGTAEQLRSLDRGSSTLALFEQTFGGHAIEDGWTFGVLACAGLAVVDGRVPVAVNEDVVAYLDEDGAGWIQDTIEDPAPRRVAADAQALVTGILLWDRHLRAPASLRMEGKRGRELIVRLGLLPIAAVTSKTERWWGDETAWIVERGAVTLVGALDAARLDGLAARPPPRAPEKKPETKRAKRAMAAPELAKVTSPMDVVLEVDKTDVTLGAFLPGSPDAVLARVMGAGAEQLGAKVAARASDGATLALPEGVELVVKIARMGKGTALRARLRGHRPEDEGAWRERMRQSLR